LVTGYLLDTNIVSELQRADRCSPQVRAWYNRSGNRALYLSVLVLGELRRGIEAVRLRGAVAARILERRYREVEADYGGHILPVTAEICDVWGRLSIRQRLPVIDGLMAATALYHRLTMVTHNTRDFLRSGVSCFDPFAG
jgi:predicted nucleic acid-binding protein